LLNESNDLSLRRRPLPRTAQENIAATLVIRRTFLIVRRIRDGLIQFLHPMARRAL
jgi:hypothetical protein